MLFRSEFPIEAELVPATIGGQPAVLVSVVDITERKEAERALAEAMNNLKRSNRDLEQFAYVASHDLQEPLRAINGFSQLLAKNYKGRLDSDADEFIAFIEEAARRAQVLIRDLLTYSRVGSQGKPLVPTDCNKALDNALQNLLLTIEENNVAIERQPLPTLLGDEVQLTQLFQNLVTNAIKFRQPDTAPRITIGAQPRDGTWEFSVHDNGIGIEPEYYDRIFVIFQRLHGREQYPGTGIGLAVCQKIVERHGGKIWVESQPGAGSTFKFTLLRAATPTTTTATAPATAAVPREPHEET